MDIANELPNLGAPAPGSPAAPLAGATVHLFRLSGLRGKVRSQGYAFRIQRSSRRGIEGAELGPDALGGDASEERT